MQNKNTKQNWNKCVGAMVGIGVLWVVMCFASSVLAVLISAAIALIGVIASVCCGAVYEAYEHWKSVAIGRGDSVNKLTDANRKVAAERDLLKADLMRINSIVVATKEYSHE
jgi:hypothetical protein